MKIPFDPATAFALIDEAIAPFPRAALFELAERGFDSPFEQLVACLISIRTYDEVSLPAALRLFGAARTPAEVTRLSTKEIDALIAPATYHEAKAPQIAAIAKRCLEEWNGELSCDRETLVSLNGVGPKCAGLTLGIACGQPFIGVDIHVHRVTNRWGYVSAKTPEKTLAALEATLPPPFWVEINRLLVPFGKHICTGNLPKCSTCPVLEMCAQVGVEKHR